MRGIKHILFVLPSYALPIPATKGGAIEELMTLMLEENEVNGKYKFTFIAPDNESRIVKYENSTIYLINPVSEIQYFYDYQANSIAKKISPDYIIMEGWASRLDNCFRNTIQKDRLAIHLHHEFPRQSIYLDSFGISIAPSKFIAERWNANASQNEKCTYIWTNAIDINKINQISFTDVEKKQLRRSLGVSEDDFVIIFCGRLAEVKGISELIEAVLQLNNSKIKLLVAGSDSYGNGNKLEYGNNIVKKINENNSYIKYLGYVNNQYIHKYYKCADLHIIPSLCEEAFGLVALEGMCNGLPIIHTNSGALPEIIPKECSIIVNKDKNIIEQLKQAIIWMFLHPEQRKIMGEYAKKYVKKYSAEQYYIDFEKLINWWDNLYE